MLHKNCPARAWRTDSLRGERRDSTCASRAELIDRSSRRKQGAGPGLFTSSQLLFLSVWETEKVACLSFFLKNKRFLFLFYSWELGAGKGPFLRLPLLLLLMFCLFQPQYLQKKYDQPHVPSPAEHVLCPGWVLCHSTLSV